MRNIRRWLLPLALLGVSYCVPVRAETLAQLISDARTLALDGASSTRQRFNDSQITQFLNTAQRDAVAQAQPLQTSIQFQLVPGTTYYPLPSDYLTMVRMTIGNLYMLEMSPAALDGKSRGWPSASGYPVYYFINWSSPTLVGFTPWPATSRDTDTIRMDYAQSAADMTNSTDQPYNGVPKLTNFHHGLAYYAAAMMLINSNQSAMVQNYLNEYQISVAGLKSRSYQRPNYLPSGAASP